MQLNQTYRWDEVSSEDSVYQNITQHLTCRGTMFDLEILVLENGRVAGVMWAEIPATFWEPADSVTIFEADYDSVDEAKAELEGRDTEAWESEVEIDEYTSVREN